jgi:putative ABC transport system permease protein
VRLSLAELRAHLGRFLGTVLGLALLFTVVLAMGGIYRGMVVDAVALVDAAGESVWLVETGRHGPFAEVSRVDPSAVERARIVPGVADAEGLRVLGHQFAHEGRSLRVTLLSTRTEVAGTLRWTVAAGRLPARAHGEIAVDRTLGLPLGATLSLADQPFIVVGTLRGAIASSGDAAGVLSEADLLDVARYLPPSDRALGLRPPNDPPLAAVLVTLQPGAARERVMRDLGEVPGVQAWTAEGQRQLLLQGAVDKARRQIGLFRVLLVVVSTALLSLVTFSLTAAKTREIALVKLLGARGRTVVSWVASQALAMTLAAYGVAVLLGSQVFPRFPRRVVIEPRDLYLGLGVALVLSAVSSAAAVRRALAVPAGEALGG